jgi:hypothetical protein
MNVFVVVRDYNTEGWSAPLAVFEDEDDAIAHMDDLQKARPWAIYDAHETVFYAEGS